MQKGSHHSKSTDEMPPWRCTKRDENDNPVCDDSGYYTETVDGIVRIRECGCLFEKEMATKIWQKVPREYHKLGWDNFTGLETCEKSQILAGIAKNHFQKKANAPDKDANHISKFFEGGKNIAIIGKTDSGVSLLAYLLMKEAAYNGFYIDKIRWSNLAATMRGVIFSKETEDDWAEKVSLLSAPDVLFIDNIRNQKISNLSDSITFLSDVLEERQDEKKTTIFGLDFIPNEQIFGPSFYNAVIHGSHCTRVFLNPLSKLLKVTNSKIEFPPEDRAGIACLKLPKRKTNERGMLIALEEGSDFYVLNEKNTSQNEKD